MEEIMINNNASICFKCTIGFTLLNVDLVGSYERKSNGYEVIIEPTPNYQNDGFTLEAMIKGINDFISKLFNKTTLNIDLTVIIEALAKYTDHFSKNVIVQIKKVYLHIEKTDKTNLFEYAFTIKIADTSVSVKEFNVVSLNSLEFAIWNTKDQQVMNSMGLYDLIKIG